jgi:GNAT superfamily N-acetyltransferase
MREAEAKQSSQMAGYSFPPPFETNSASRAKLRTVVDANVPEIAHVHLDSFPDSALTKLGAEAVCRYYSWLLDPSHEAVRASGAYIDDKCVGYSFSGLFNASTSGFISRNRNLLARRLLLRPWLLFDPMFRSRLGLGLKLLKAFSKRKRPSANSDPLRRGSFGILAIAVIPENQKLGIGKLLMDDAENEAVRLGFKKMHLTVNPQNRKAIRFYEKLNWSKTSQDEAWRGSMVKVLD